MGRFMRAPDGHDGDDPDPVVEPPEDPAGAAETDEQKAAREAEETKAREGETDEQKAEREKAEARAGFYGAPAEDAPYEITGLPDGMEIDAKALEAITPVARQLDLSPAGLSLLAKTYAEHVLPDIAERYKNDLETSIATQRRDWEAETREAIAGKVELKNAAGEAITFDGKDQKGVEAMSAKALDKLAPAGLREFLAESGLGNNVLLTAFVYNAGKAIAEERELEPSGGDIKNRGKGGPPMTDPDKFYGK